MVFLRQPDGNVNMAVVQKLAQGRPKAAPRTRFPSASRGDEIIGSGNFVDLGAGGSSGMLPNANAALGDDAALEMRIIRR